MNYKIIVGILLCLLLIGVAQGAVTMAYTHGTDTTVLTVTASSGTETAYWTPPPGVPQAVITNCGAGANGNPKTLTPGATLALEVTAGTPGVITFTTPLVGTRAIETFKGVGSATWTPPTWVTNVDYLVVAGGGAGGQSFAGGGGGGGVLTGTLAVSGPITVTVGKGGTGTATDETQGQTGDDSVFSTITAHGGGGGGHHLTVGSAGGSGGGGGLPDLVPPNYTAGGNGISGEGYAGGRGIRLATGGGGGAGGIGENANVDGSNYGGDGGAGLSSSITGAPLYYGDGGGGGGWTTYGVGGSGNGGHGAIAGGAATPTRGAANTGSGGGGAISYDGITTSGSGGSGIVIIRYALNPQANFTANVTGGVVPLPVLFTDTSTLIPKVWNWSVNASDGSRGSWYNYTTSTNLAHTFTSAGLYNVSLSVQNITDSPTITTKQMNIRVNSTLQADFVGAPLSGVFVPQTVSFVDFSTGAELYAWSWNFGDGSTSTTRNPTHQYLSAGSFTVSLTTSGVDGTSTKTAPNYVVISTGGGFTATRISSYQYAMPVYFYDVYPSGHTAWLWDFGDGYTSTDRDVTHIYSVARSYTVSLAATDAVGTNTSVRSNYINLYSDEDTNLKSRLHMNGVAGGTSFPGEEGNVWTPTSVTTETAQKKFGTASSLFNGAGDRLQTPSSSIFNFGTDDFTIEQQVYLTSDSTGDTIISRTSNGATRVDGWGIYDSTNTNAGWKFWAGALQTNAFTMTLNTWHHLSVQRRSGTVYVYVDGISAATPLTAEGNYDTTNAIVYGKPITGGGVSAARMYLDETSISTISRWQVGTGSFSPPYAEYAGNISASFVDDNPGSTMRFKANLTPRYRTLQVQNINITNVINATMTYNENHFSVGAITPNTSQLAGIAVTYSDVDNNLGQIHIGLERVGGFTSIGQSESRLSVADIRMTYWNYTEPEEDNYWDSDDDMYNTQSFSNGFLTNTTNGVVYPVHNFIATNVTVNDWITFAKPIADTTTPILGETPVKFYVENNFTSTRVLWDFGDNTTFLSANQTELLHIYPISSGSAPKTVTATAYLWQNTSVTNTSSRVGYINPIYPTTYIHADFSANPTAGSVGTNIVFKDLTIWGNTSAVKQYNWSWGDGTYSSLAGNTNHVYTSLGTFTVTLIVNNTANLTLENDDETKVNYIILSTSQQTTFYTPHQVAFQVLDSNWNPIANTMVSAHAVESTLPGGLSGGLTTLQNTYGIPSVTAQQMLDPSVSYVGHTDSYGYVAILLLSTIKYEISVVDTSGAFYNVTKMPDGSYYQIKTENATVQSVFRYAASDDNIYNGKSLFVANFTEPNSSYGTMSDYIYDNSGHTLGANCWWKLMDNGTIWWDNQTWVSGSGVKVFSKTVPSVPYQQWRWGCSTV